MVYLTYEDRICDAKKYAPQKLEKVYFCLVIMLAQGRITKYQYRYLMSL